MRPFRASARPALTSPALLSHHPIPLPWERRELKLLSPLSPREGGGGVGERGWGSEGRAVGLLFFLLLALAAPAAAEIEVRALLEPEVVSVDETAVLTVEVRGGGFARLRFQPDFELDNLEIVGGPFQYEDMVFGSGPLSRSFRLSWQVRPLRVGRARVHAISVRLRNEIRQLPDREIEVRDEPPAGSSRRSGRRPAQDMVDPFDQLFGRLPLPWRQSRPETPGVFLKAEIEPQRPVVGEQVLYTVYLYTREDITAITPSGVPPFRGFWARDIPLPQHLPTDMVEIDGGRYARVPLLKKALFPLRPGRSRIEPTRMDLAVRHFERRFFGPPLTSTDQVQVETDPVTIDVQPLPPAPPGFSGAVGRLALAASLTPRELRLGEAATLTVTLSGEGNLQGVEEPQLQAPSGLTLSPPQQGSTDEISGTRVKGSRTWSYVVIPDRAGRYSVETPAIPYFDPVSRSYQVASATPLDLTALPRAAAGSAGEGELHGIRVAAAPGNAAAPGRWTALLPWLFVLPWGLALAVTLARRRPAVPGAAEPARDRGAERRLRERLAEVQKEERPRQMAALLEDGWRELLAQRWAVPQETPSHRWAETLILKQAPDDAVEELARLVDDLHYLRYAPQLSATEALRGEALAKSRRLLSRLR
jgi:hypothetical protein